jgi:hypothetical protein
MANKEAKGNPNWKKGVSGNPKGRPKRGETYTDLLLEIGNRIDPETGKTNKQILSEKLWRKAKEEEDMAAMKYLYDRVIGTPKQTVEANIYQEVPPVVEEIKTIRKAIEEDADK